MKKLLVCTVILVLVLSLVACGSSKKSNLNQVEKNVSTKTENVVTKEVVKEEKKQRNPDIVTAEKDIKNGNYTQAMERIKTLKDSNSEAKTVYFYAWIKRDEHQWQKEVIDYEPMVAVLSDRYDGDLKEDIKKYKRDYYDKRNKAFAIPENPAKNDIREKCAVILNSDLMDVDIIEGVEDNTYGVVVKTKAIDSALTDSLLKQKNLDRCSDIFYTLYTSKYNFMYVTVISYVNAVDSYGRNRDAVLMKCTLKQNTARRVNWNNLSSVKWERILDEYRVPRELR